MYQPKAGMAFKHKVKIWHVDFPNQPFVKMVKFLNYQQNRYDWFQIPVLTQGV